MSSENPQKAAGPYRVLARKYRPQNFEQLIGQEALVRTLKNAIESGRIAHAFMLTGVRGVGKTTTARIIAKALNYTGPDGQSGPTTGPTDDCRVCKAISEDRHPDVIEMDAASRTGVDDIRDITDGVRYAPSEARYKIYIIDEVHMLSKNAFNALLKTLEEPPSHVKFIFATTEIRKVPITVLSRCQRFDLRRVDVPTLSDHYQKICELENVKAQSEAIALIARAADGSVRDGLSILDQAIALSNGDISAQQVETMLGLGDRSRTLELLGCVLEGHMPEALAMMDDLYKRGVDPVVLIQDLLDIIHQLTRLRAAPQSSMGSAGASEHAGLQQLAAKLSMPVLGKAWQILLKGLAEVQSAPNTQNAAEMVLIRLAYAAELPDPVDLIKKLQDGSPAGGSRPRALEHSSSMMAQTVMQGPPPYSESPRTSGGGEMAALARSEPAPHRHISIHTIEDIVATLEQAGDMFLAGNIRLFVHPVKIEDTPQAGRIELRLAPDAPPKLSQDIGPALTRVTGKRWMAILSQSPGESTIAGKKNAALAAERAEIMQIPAIQEILEIFPGAEIKSVQHPIDKD